MAKMIFPEGVKKLTVEYHRTNMRHMSEYEPQLRKEMADMDPYLPEHVSSILEIGPGIGGMGILLRERYPDALLTFVDKPGVVKFDSSSFDTDIFFKMMIMNEVRDFEVSDTIPDRPYGLCISTLSWGFHYPIEEYFDAVNRLCHGPIIIDVRPSSEKLGTLIGKYGHGGEARRIVLDRDRVLSR